MRAPAVAAKFERIEVAAYSIPTETEESDGTYAWHKTTLVLVEASGGGATGLGYSYADTATATLIRDALAQVVTGLDAMDLPRAWSALVGAVRNLGRPGISSMAISAIDNALWDLKARLLGVPLVSLLGAARPALPIYGSGGFCNYSDAQLREQLGGWVAAGIPRVKMKIGREPKRDLARIKVAREAIGDAELFIDANGAYARKQALRFAQEARELGVTWFEEPVSSDDLEGLRLLRDQAPPGLEIAAGEYGYESLYFERMLRAGAVDVLQADATRCAGITGFLQAAVLAATHQVPLSSHCAPAQHLHAGCAAPGLRHAEYFFDHVRIEQMLFDGLPQPKDGALAPDLSQPGNGLIFKRADAEKFRVE